MSEQKTNRVVRSGVAISAVSFAALGFLLLFAPAETGGAIISSEGNEPLIQLLGAALLGFGAMNWIARGSILGGIYGRAVVAANQTHLTIGALLLAKHGFAEGGSTAFWILTAVYALGAALFIRMFLGSGISAR